MRKTILLRHKSGWLIVCDNSGFPSSNYLVFKDKSWKPGDKLPSHSLMYCSSLKDALASVFQQLIVVKVNDAVDYRASMMDLRAAIESARSELDELLKLPGVGRKTANLVLTLGFGKSGICVDTCTPYLELFWLCTNKNSG